MLIPNPNTLAILQASASTAEQGMHSIFWVLHQASCLFFTAVKPLQSCHMMLFMSFAEGFSLRLYVGRHDASERPFSQGWSAAQHIQFIVF